MSNTQIIITAGIVIGAGTLLIMYRNHTKFQRLIMLNKKELEDPKPKDNVILQGKNITT